MEKVYCGIDWAENHHDVALVDAEGNLVAKRRIADSVAGFAELTAMLADAGDSEDAPIPVAIETSRGLLVAALRATGRPVYPINPMAVARYRERHSVSRKKSDHVDAMTLANILRTDAHMHRPLPADTELARAIAVLARAHQDATWRRTRASNELRSLLREYHPGFLACLRRWQRHQPGHRRCPCRVGDCADPGGRRQADQGSHRGRATAGRPQARRGQARRAAPPATFGGRSCVKTRWWKRRWAPRRCGCWPPWTPSATASTSSATPSLKRSPPTPTTRSSPASPGWVTSPAPGCSPRSAMTVPASPTLDR